MNSDLIKLKVKSANVIDTDIQNEIRLKYRIDNLLKNHITKVLIKYLCFLCL